MQRIVCWLLAGIGVWLFPQSVLAVAEVSVEPVEIQRAVQPGTSFDVELTVTNHGAGPHAIEVSCARLIHDDGGFLRQSNDERCGWLTLDALELTLPATGRQTLTGRVTIPPNVPGGEMTMLLVELREKADSVSDSALVIPLILTHSSTAAATSTTVTTAATEPQNTFRVNVPWVAWRLPVPVQIEYENAGTAALTVDVTGRVIDQLDRTTAMFSAQGLAPPQTTTSLGAVTLVPRRPIDAWLGPIGHYTVEAQVAGATQDTLSQTSTWAVPVGTLAILVLIMLCGTLLTYSLSHWLDVRLRAVHLSRWQRQLLDALGTAGGLTAAGRIALFGLSTAGVRLVAAAEATLILRFLSSLLTGSVLAASFSFASFAGSPAMQSEIAIRASVPPWTFYEKRVVGHKVLYALTWNHDAGVLVLGSQSPTVHTAETRFTRLAAFPRSKAGREELTETADTAVLILTNIDEPPLQ